MSLLRNCQAAAVKRIVSAHKASRPSCSRQCAAQAYAYRSTAVARTFTAKASSISCVRGLTRSCHTPLRLQLHLTQHFAQQQTQQRVGVRAMASSSNALSLEVVDIHNPKELNFILGHAHFIKTVEDLYEALIQSSPSLKFGIAFNEASPGYEAMPGRKVRFDGNDDEMIELAKKNAMSIGAGHTFIIFIDGGFPVNCLNAVKAVPEVCRVHCATANPTSVIIAKTSEDAKGILGVIDGVVPTDFETDDDKKKRHEFLRMIGYKR